MILQFLVWWLSFTEKEDIEGTKVFYEGGMGSGQHFGFAQVMFTVLIKHAAGQVQVWI